MQSVIKIRRQYAKNMLVIEGNEKKGVGLPDV